MFRVETVLVLVSRTHDNPEPLVLINNDRRVWSLPNGEVSEQESSFTVAARMVEESTGLRVRMMGVGWVDLISAPVADEATRTRGGQRWLAVPYVALLPMGYCSCRAPMRWVSIAETLAGEGHEDHKEIMSAALRLL